RHHATKYRAGATFKRCAGTEAATLARYGDCAGAAAKSGRAFPECYCLCRRVQCTCESAVVPICLAESEKAGDSSYTTSGLGGGCVSTSGTDSRGPRAARTVTGRTLGP